MMDVTTLSDEQLVEYVRTKDKESYAEIINRYQEKLLRYATYLLGDTHVAADVVQQAFISAFINLQGFDKKKKFSSWIYRIVHNEAINAVKKQKQHLRMEYDTEYESDIKIEDAYIKEELIRETHMCLTKMPILYSEPLSLFFLEEKTYEEISDILHIPIGTVGTRINRAKGMMKALCQKKQI